MSSISSLFKVKIENFLLKIHDKSFIKGISTLIGASILNFLVGAIFSLCTLSVYEISYIKDKGGKIKIEHLTFYYPIEIIFQYISAFFSGKIYKDLGLHTTNLIGTTVLTFSYFLMYISNSLFLDLFSMIIGGIGTGIILYPSTINAYEWFIEHNGLIVGIMETMISLGSFFFAFIGEIIINKEKQSSRKEDSLYDFKIGKRIKIYLIMQMITLDIAFLISYGLMFEKKEEEDILKDLEDNSHLIRFETSADIQEQIEHIDNIENKVIDINYDNDMNLNIKINEKNNVGSSDSDKEDTNETIQKSKVENNDKEDKESETEDNIKIIVNGELIEEEKDLEVNYKGDNKKENKEEIKEKNKVENKAVLNEGNEYKKEEKKEEPKKIEKEESNKKIYSEDKKLDNNNNNKVPSIESIELIKENKDNTKKSNIKDEKEEPLLIKDPPIERIKSKENSSNNGKDQKRKNIKKILIMALKSKRLFLFSIIVILQAPVSNMSFSLYREIGEYYKIDVNYLQLVGSLYFIFECLSSFVFGLLCDYIQLKYLLFFINGVGTIVGFIYCLTFKNSLVFFLVQNFLSFSAGGYYPVKDCFLMKVFGKDIYIELSGYVSFLVAISVNLLTPITYFVSGLKEKDMAYLILFISFGSLNLIGLILNFFIKETPIDFEKNNKNEKIDEKIKL